MHLIFSLCVCVCLESILLVVCELLPTGLQGGVSSAHSGHGQKERKQGFPEKERI